MKKNLYKTKKFFKETFFLCLTLALLFPVYNTKASDEIRANEIIIKYKENKIDLETRTGRAKAKLFEIGNNLEKIDDIKDENIRLVKSSDNPKEVVEDLKNNSKIEIAEPNYTRTLFATPNDTFFSSVWALNNTGQSVNGTSGTSDADIDAPEAWDAEQSSFENITVAVIDTGVRYDHLDLADNMWNGTGCKDENNNSVPGGCPNHGWDYGSNDNDPNDAGDSEGDSIGHGTHVSGIIGAVSNNSRGISGVSNQNHLKIMAVRFGFDTFSEVKAINFAKNNGAKVINASFGGYTFTQLEKDAIDSFPGIFVAAAGNGGPDEIADNNDSTPVYPCSYSSSNIICVAATDQNDAITSFSNYGATSVDIAAPGNNNLSAYYLSTTSYAYMSGTSMATPLVAGLAGALYSAKSSISQSTVKSAILTSGNTLDSLSGKTVSSKRVNFKNALDTVLVPETPQPQPTPQQETPAAAPSPSVSDVILSYSGKSYLMNTQLKYSTKGKTFMLLGSSQNLNGGLVKIYRGRNGFTITAVSLIDSQGNWNARITAPKGNALFKVAYFDSSGNDTGLSQVYYIQVAKKKKK